MRIAYFSESLLPNMDGVSHTFNQLINTLQQQKIEFRFYSPFKPGQEVEWSERVRQMKAVSFPLYRQYKVSVPLLDNPEEDIEQFNPDILHVAAPTFLSFYAIRFAKKRDIPVVASYHTHWVSYFSYYGFKGAEGLGWRVLRWFHNQCDATYTPSSSAKRELESAGIKNVQLWPRGIDVKKFSPKYRSEPLRKQISAKDLPFLLFVGRLVKEKDVEDLIAADHWLKKQKARYKLVFVGEGPMAEDIQQELPDAYLAGYKKDEELANFYASSDIFVFPSTTETFGNVVQEAMASGLPVIGVKEGGVQDLIDDGCTGLLARPNDPQDLGQKIFKLLQNPDLRNQMTQEALNRMQNRTWEAVNMRLIDSYKQIIHSRNGRQSN
ncbi:MAG: glycosyltransferase [Caldithrix sp.]|nr:glycosyltransferase [Caldithrix sp.]